MDKDIITKASKIFNRSQDGFVGYFSPGRINLIGEHIDYNGGVVLPCGLDFGTVGAVAVNDTPIVRCYSENFKQLGVISFSIDDIKKEDGEDWVSFVKGLLIEMNKDGNHFETGFDLFVRGDIPNGAGLSSSASLEVLLGMIMRDLYDLKYCNIDLALLGQRCEHNYINVNCGIMDQFAIAMGRAKSAILLNTNTLDYKYINADFGDNVIIIGNTNYRRTLQDSKYNERRAECEEGLKELQKYLDIKTLCEMNPDDFEKYQDKLEPTIRKRVKHVVYENQRTIEACSCLESQDFTKFGELLNQSHKSLKEDYEVTGLALDSLVDSFYEEDILGARMTGAGFGGCMIALVNKDKLEGMLERVNERYYQKTNLKAAFYVARIGTGPRRL